MPMRQIDPEHAAVRSAWWAVVERGHEPVAVLLAAANDDTGVHIVAIELEDGSVALEHVTARTSCSGS